MQVIFFKTDKTEEVKGYKKCPFTYFSTKIFARTERKEKPFCKTKIIILSFRVGGLMSW